MAGQQIGDAGSRTLVRYMQHVQLGQHQEQFHRQMRAGADAGRGKIDLPGPRFREGDELLQVARRQRRVNHQHVGQRNRLRDRRQILQRVIGHFFVHRRIDRQRADTHQQRVAVRGCARHGFAADHGARARPVFDDDLLAEELRQLRRDDARRDVGAAARR